MEDKTVSIGIRTRNRSKVTTLMKQASEWAKVVYKESDDIVRCAQGFVRDSGDFLEVLGDYKIVRINKQAVVSIASRRGNEDGRSS